MDFRGAIRRGLVLAVCVSASVACSRADEPPAADARVGFCVGIDEAHPEGSNATVTFMRGDETLGRATGVVTGSVSVPVTPGEVTVDVDGTSVAILTASSGTTAYASTGRDCPATPPF